MLCYPVTTCWHCSALPLTAAWHYEVLHVKQPSAKMACNQRGFHPTFSLMSWLQNMSKLRFGPKPEPETESKEREEMMAATDMLWGRRGRSRSSLLKTTTCLYIQAQLWISRSPSLVSGCYLKGDCGLALSQRDLESNISHHMET